VSVPRSRCVLAHPSDGPADRLLVACIVLAIDQHRHHIALGLDRIDRAAVALVGAVLPLRYRLPGGAGAGGSCGAVEHQPNPRGNLSRKAGRWRFSAVSRGLIFRSRKAGSYGVLLLR
jgi:hypothetical protein